MAQKVLNPLIMQTIPKKKHRVRHSKKDSNALKFEHYQ